MEYMNQHDLVGIALVMNIDSNVLNDKNGRRALRRRFVDQLEIAAAIGVFAQDRAQRPIAP
jgi:hypothetical protein